MKKLETFGNFSENIKQTNESAVGNTVDYIGTILNNFIEKFKQKASAFIAIYLSKKNKLPKDKDGNPKVLIRVPREWYNDPVYTKMDEELEKDNIVLADDISEGIVPLFVGEDQDITNVDTAKLKKHIIRQWKINRGKAAGKLSSSKKHVLFIWGAPGIGKTEITHQIAKELGLQVQVWTLATLDPTDLKGVPLVVKIMNKLFPHRTSNATPSILPRTNWNGKNEEGGILFFDEFNRAIPPVLNASLSLILNGKLDRYVLPSKWFIVCAGNKMSDLAQLAGTEMTTELANRFTHINLVPTYKEYAKHVKNNPKTNPDILDFLSFDQSFFHRMMDDAEILDVNPAYPTPRQWDLASEDHWDEVDGDWDNKVPIEELIRIYKRHVGKEAAVTFAAFVDMKDTYNEADIIDTYKRGHLAKPLPKRLDQAFGVIIAITSYIANKKRDITPDELNNLYDYGLGIKDSEKVEAFLNKIRHYYPYVQKEPQKYPKHNDVRNKWIKIWHKRTQDEELKLKGLTI